MDLVPSQATDPQHERPTSRAHGASHLAASSLKAYERDLRHFYRWGGTVPCTAENISAFLLSQPSRLAPMTVYRRAMAVRYAHISQGLSSPLEEKSIKWMLQQLLKGFSLKESKSTRPSKPKNKQSAKPMTRALLLRMFDAMHRSTLDRRDRALLLLGYLGALNRTRLAAINVTDVEFSADSVSIRNGERVLVLPATGGDLCPAAALRAWIQHAQLELDMGPLFRRFDRGSNATADRLDAAYVSVVIKERLEAVGVDPKGYSAHSLRRGRLIELGKGLL